MESNLVPKKDKRHCFDLMNHLFASVIWTLHTLLVHLTCGTLSFYHYMSWSWPSFNSGRRDIDGHIQDTYRIPDARELDKPHTTCNAQETFIHRTSLSGGVCSNFEHVQNLPTDKTGQNGYYLTHNTFTSWGTDKKLMWTDTNGQRILLSVTSPLALSGRYNFIAY